MANALRLQASALPPTSLLRSFLAGHVQWNSYEPVLCRATRAQLSGAMNQAGGTPLPSPGTSPSKRMSLDGDGGPVGLDLDLEDGDLGGLADAALGVDGLNSLKRDLEAIRESMGVPKFHGDHGHGHGGGEKLGSDDEEEMALGLMSPLARQLGFEDSLTPWPESVADSGGPEDEEGESYTDVPDGSLGNLRERSGSTSKRAASTSGGDDDDDDARREKMSRLKSNSSETMAEMAELGDLSGVVDGIVEYDDSDEEEGNEHNERNDGRNDGRNVLDQGAGVAADEQFTCGRRARDADDPEGADNKPSKRRAEAGADREVDRDACETALENLQLA